MAVPARPASAPPALVPTVQPAAAAAALLAPATPQAVWEALLARVADRPSMGWIRKLELRQLEGSQARVQVISGGRELVQFVAGPRRQQLAELLQQIVGRPVRIELEAPTGALDGAEDGISQTEPAAGRASGVTTARGTTAPAPGSAPASGLATAPGGRTAPADSDRQKALANPLVKQVMDVFDAAIVRIGPEAPAAAPEAALVPAGRTPQPTPELFPTPVPAPSDDALAGEGLEDVTGLAPGPEELEGPEDQDNV